MEGRVFVPAVAGEESLVPLTDGQGALRVVPDLEVVRGVEAVPVLGLDSRGRVGSVEGSDQDVADEVSGLGRSEIECSFRPEADLRSLFNSAEAVPEFHASLSREVDQRVGEVGVQP